MATWIATVTSLLVLGLVMGFSPTLYGICLAYLVQGAPGRRAVAWISLGLAIGCTLLFIVYQFVDGTIVSTYLSSGVRAIVMQRWVDLVAGVLLLLAAGLLSWRARRGPTAPRPKPDRRHRPDDSSPRTAAALGFANAFMGSSGFATMYVVARVVSVVGPDLALRALAYLTFIPTLVGPYLILAWSWNRWPRMATAITRAYDLVVHHDYHKLVIIGLLVGGVLFIGLGVKGFLDPA